MILVLTFSPSILPNLFHILSVFHRWATPHSSLKQLLYNQFVNYLIDESSRIWFRACPSRCSLFTERLFSLFCSKSVERAWKKINRGGFIDHQRKRVVVGEEENILSSLVCMEDSCSCLNTFEQEASANVSTESEYCLDLHVKQKLS